MAKERYLLLVRHGETVGNLEQIAHGQTESPLNDRGIQQATMTAEMLKTWQRPYDRIYASPLSRAHHTGKIFAEHLQLPLHKDEDLNEGSLGDWEEVTYEELNELGFAQKSIRNDDFDGHGGETPNQLGQRLVNAVEAIRKKHPVHNIIVVSHGAAISHLLARVLDTKPAFGHQYLMHNAAVTEISFMHGCKPEVTTFNYHDHLPAELIADPMRRDQNVGE